MIVPASSADVGWAHRRGRRRSIVERVSDDPERARRLGARARATVERWFGKERFAESRVGAREWA